MLVGLSVVFGLLATIISGEVFISWGFFPIHIALVVLAAAVTTALATSWRRRSTPLG